MIYYTFNIREGRSCFRQLKEIFDCCKQSLTRLNHPPIHPSIHQPVQCHTFLNEKGGAQKGAHAKLLYIFAPIVCKLQDRLRSFYFQCEQVIYNPAQPSIHPPIHSSSAIFLQKRAYAILLYIFAPIMCKLQDFLHA